MCCVARQARLCAPLQQNKTRRRAFGLACILAAGARWRSPALRASDPPGSAAAGQLPPGGCLLAVHRLYHPHAARGHQQYSERGVLRLAPRPQRPADMQTRAMTTAYQWMASTGERSTLDWFGVLTSQQRAVTSCWAFSDPPSQAVAAIPPLTSTTRRSRSRQGTGGPAPSGTAAVLTRSHRRGGRPRPRAPAAAPARPQPPPPAAARGLAARQRGRGGGGGGGRAAEECGGGGAARGRRGPGLSAKRPGCFLKMKTEAACFCPVTPMFRTTVTIYPHLISQAGWNRCNLSIYLSCSLSQKRTSPSRPGVGLTLRDEMSVLVSAALFCAVTDTLYWDVPGHVLAAPASALCGWTGVTLSPSPSLAQLSSASVTFRRVRGQP